MLSEIGEVMETKNLNILDGGSSRQKPLKILVVEDCADFANLIRIALGSDLHRIELAATGEGKGCVFCLSLPIETDDLTSENTNADNNSKPQRSDSEKPLKNMRVLLAEDIEDLRELYRSYIIAAGANLETASDGQEALEKILRDTYDIVLLDLMMPELGGMDVVRKTSSILAGKAGKIPKFIAITAHASKDDVAICRSIGFADVIFKPVSSTDLVDSILRHSGSF